MDMETQNFKSTEAIEEALNILEDSEEVDADDIDVWYKEFRDEQSDVISEVEIRKLGIRYVNECADDELHDVMGSYDANRSAEWSYRYA